MDLLLTGIIGVVLGINGIVIGSFWLSHSLEHNNRIIYDNHIKYQLSKYKIRKIKSINLPIKKHI